MKTNESAVFLVGEGTVTALAGGPLSLADMGARTTKRASHLIFNEDLNEWIVQDAETFEVLFTHPDYDVALAWEKTEYNRRLAESV